MKIQSITNKHTHQPSKPSERDLTKFPSPANSYNLSFLPLPRLCLHFGENGLCRRLCIYGSWKEGQVKQESVLLRAQLWRGSAVSPFLTAINGTNPAGSPWDPKPSTAQIRKTHEEEAGTFSDIRMCMSHGSATTSSSIPSSMWSAPSKDLDIRNSHVPA